MGYYRAAGVDGERCVACSEEEVITSGTGATSEDACDMSIGSRSKQTITNNQEISVTNAMFLYLFCVT